jgi:hypothetical protein
MKAAPGHKGLSVSEADAISYVLGSLYMFLMDPLWWTAENSDEGAEDNTRHKVLSVTQDLVYGITGGKKWTPKYIGLGRTLHQAARFRDQVQLFNKAGHCLSYEQVFQVDTS